MNSRLTSDSGPVHPRSLIVQAVAPSAIGVAVAMTIALIVLGTSPGSMSGGGFVAAMSYLWFAAHLVPVTVSNVTVGVLPIVPAIGMLWMVRRSASRSAKTTDPRFVVGAAVGGPLVIALILYALLGFVSTDVPSNVPNFLSVVGCVAGIHLLGALWGVLTVWGDAVSARIGPWLRAALQDAGRAVAAFLIVGCVIVLIRSVMAWHGIFAIFGTGHSVVGGIGLAALSIAYLPNVIVAVISVLVGSHAELGGATVSMMDVRGGHVPPLPVAALMPSEGHSSLWMMLLIFPIAIAVWIGWRASKWSSDLWPTLRQVVATALLTASAVVVLMVAVGGSLGVLGYAGPEVLFTGLFTFAWMAVVGLFAATLVQLFADSRAEVQRISHEEDAARVDDPKTEQTTSVVHTTVKASIERVPADQWSEVFAESDLEDVPQVAAADMVDTSVQSGGSK